MTEQEIKQFTINEILVDLKSILTCLQICAFNKVNFSIYMGIVPYMCTFVYAAYEFLKKEGMIAKNIDKTFTKKIKKVRSKFLKQYVEFKQGTYNSLNNFNRNEYIKHFNKIYPGIDVFFDKTVCNYYVATLNNLPIDNYHLSSSILNCEIGSYKEDIAPDVQSFICNMIAFVKELLLSFANDSFEDPTNKIEFENIQYFNFNMAYGYKNFAIKDNPPILMAFLDILCAINSFNTVFKRINVDQRLELKIGYLLLFESKLGIEQLIKYCKESLIDINPPNTLIEYIADIRCVNQLRNYCAHYDYNKQTWHADPIVEAFEYHFKQTLNIVDDMIKAWLLDLGRLLNNYLIPYNLTQC